ncbi:hypothetical protein ACLOJK_017984 [Asimina triloba]
MHVRTYKAFGRDAAPRSMLLAKESPVTVIAYMRTQSLDFRPGVQAGVILASAACLHALRREAAFSDQLSASTD